MRQLTLKGRLTVFKSLGVSKVIHLLLITKLHNNPIKICIKYRKTLFGKEKRQKLKIVLFPMTMKSGV